MSDLEKVAAEIALELTPLLEEINQYLDLFNESATILCDGFNLYQKANPEFIESILVKNKLEKSDVEFISKDFFIVSNKIKIYLKALVNTSNNLSNLYLYSQDQFKLIDVNASWKLILQSLQERFQKNANRPQINVQTQYEKVPLIQVEPSSIRIVFWGIINNAIDAINEAYSKGNSSLEKLPTIQIETSASKKNVVIRVADNGIGMSDQTKSRIFQPFFTTKDMGKQPIAPPLSWCRFIIVDQYIGQLNCVSSLGQGTEFWIKIPQIARQMSNEDSFLRLTDELKNLVSFIYGNINSLKEYLKLLMRLLEEYPRHYPDSLIETKEKIEEIHLDSLTENLLKTLDDLRAILQRALTIKKILGSFN